MRGVHPHLEGGLSAVVLTAPVEGTSSNSSVPPAHPQAAHVCCQLEQWAPSVGSKGTWAVAPRPAPFSVHAVLAVGCRQAPASTATDAATTAEACAPFSPMTTAAPRCRL